MALIKCKTCERIGYVELIQETCPYCQDKLSGKRERKINQNNLAMEIARREKGVVQANIGEIKEQLKITLELLAGYNIDEVNELLEKHKRR